MSLKRKNSWLLNEFEEEVTKSELINYWCRIFSSFKKRDENYKVIITRSNKNKQYLIFQEFVQDDSRVDWEEILDLVVEVKLKNFLPPLIKITERMLTLLRYFQKQGKLLLLSRK